MAHRTPDLAVRATCSTMALKYVGRYVTWCGIFISCIPCLHGDAGRACQGDAHHLHRLHHHAPAGVWDPLPGIGRPSLPAKGGPRAAGHLGHALPAGPSGQHPQRGHRQLGAAGQRRWRRHRLLLRVPAQGAPACIPRASSSCFSPSWGRMPGSACPASHVLAIVSSQGRWLPRSSKFNWS